MMSQCQHTQHKRFSQVSQPKASLHLTVKSPGEVAGLILEKITWQKKELEQQIFIYENHQ